MYVCGSCGSILKKTGASMGLCPRCSRDSLDEKMLCPDCGEEMDGPTEVEIMRQAWICRKCDIKAYKEKYEK
jgi:predicted amidophosphoribosyltransferase